MSAPTYTPIQTKNHLSLIDQFPSNTPITVLHLLHFHPVALYPASSPHASLPPISGRDAFYTRYVPAGILAAQECGITPGETKFFSGTVMSLLRDSETPWDVVTMRTYRSFEEYARYQASELYRENAVPHREAALKGWEVLVCVEGVHP
ncbi:hypothetical protein ONS95_014148 [Cadophora gregata]|uniref:uncharacterized protein n=1 Tax=Cadophora gregata TaxID=51156 RepID=UPI0026DC1934|nr:uncharacterized protein ONS95_014148 [Cadophora gregata]KAK0113905.1 hypothetical protein ONS96_014755 [Cadophora gregata f. sp. sojae]KAK0114663.1 hypothetical protein ONS95_014148 [Cadophora gregata]